MTPDTLAILLSVASWRRYLDHWAGVPPYQREPYVESVWLDHNSKEAPMPHSL